MSKGKSLLYGLYASIIAFVIIEGLLIEVIFEGVMSPYEGLSLFFMASLIPIGLVAYYGYLNWLDRGKDIFKYASSIALILGIISIIRGYMGFQDAPIILFVAYLIEVVVGPYLMLGFKDVDKNSALIFVFGILAFVFTLPLVSISNTLAFLPLTGNLFKGIGLIRLTYKILQEIKISDVEMLQASLSS